MLISPEKMKKKTSICSLLLEVRDEEKETNGDKKSNENESLCNSNVGESNAESGNALSSSESSFT